MKTYKSKPHQNPSGCTDLTPYKAISNITREEIRVRASEAHEQITLFQWARVNERRLPDLWCLHAIPNGGSRHKAEALNLKRQGVKAGVSDVFLPVAKRGYHGLYIEMKAKNGRISDAQKDWINQIRKNDYMALVCYGADEAVGVLEWYLSPEEV